MYKKYNCLAEVKWDSELQEEILCIYSLESGKIYLRDDGDELQKALLYFPPVFGDTCSHYLEGVIEYRENGQYVMEAKGMFDSVVQVTLIKDKITDIKFSWGHCQIKS